MNVSVWVLAARKPSQRGTGGGRALRPSHPSPIPLDGAKVSGEGLFDERPTTQTSLDVLFCSFRSLAFQHFY